MQRVDGPTAAPALPEPLAVSGTPGYFAHGDLPSGTPYTTPPPDWFNGVQEELIGVIVAGGETPDKSNNAQLLAALQALFVAKGGGSDIYVGANEISVPLAGGLIMKAGSDTGTYSEGALSHVFHTAFPNGCFCVVATTINSGAVEDADIWPQRQTKSANGFTLFLNWDGGSGTTNSISGADWIAIGN